MGQFIFHGVNCPFSTALSLTCSICFDTKDSVNEQCVCVSDSLVEEMGGKFHLYVYETFYHHFLFIYLFSYLFIALTLSHFFSVVKANIEEMKKALHLLF